MTDGGLPPPLTPAREMSAYPAYPPSPYPPHAHSGPPPSTTLATWALVLAIVPTCIGNLVAIGLAIAVLLHCRDGRNHGKGQAIAALVVAPLWLLLLSVGFVQGVVAGVDRETSAAGTMRGDVSVESLEVGDCFPTIGAENSSSRTVELVPCSERHTGEVFARFDLPKGDFPGKAQALRLAQGGCAKRIDSYVAAEDLSGVKMTFYYPMEATWARHRTITCIVVTASPSTGTLKGTES